MRLKCGTCTDLFERIGLERLEPKNVEHAADEVSVIA